MSTSTKDACDVFLSYMRTDTLATEVLRTRLTEVGLRVFLDRYALPAGQSWQPQLEAALASCRALVVLLGPSGLGEWQKREIQLGLDRQAAADKATPFPLIPVLLPGLQKDDIPLGRFLGLNTWVDLRQGLDEPEALQCLIAGVQGKAIDQTAAARLLAGLSPYRGLLPFREQDAGLFFGRERFVGELVAKVRQRTTTNTVAVVGRSGSGKSSIVYAGLFPALRREKGVGQQAVWAIIGLRPLAEPMHQLARVFAPQPNDASPIAARAALNADVARLRECKVTLAELVRDRLQAETGSTRLLLYVDQWEELYTLAQSREVKTEEDQRRAADARLFVDLLLEAAATAPCTLVLSVRSDFYPDIQNHDALRTAVRDGQVSLGPMSEPELRAAINGPAKAVGAQVHPDLTKRLIRDIGLDVSAGQRNQYDIGKLPLLEYALERAWTRRIGSEIGLGQYAGLEQALEERANQLYERLSEEQKAAAKRLFVSLVTPGEGREDTRARITVPRDPTTLAVIQTFAGTDARLLVTGDSVGRRSAEVSHEALIRHWDKLRAWVDENRENLRTRAALTSDRAEWLKQDRNSSLLIQPGLRLEAARKLYDQPGDVVIDEIKDYIEASLAEDVRRRFWRRASFVAVAAVAVIMAGLAVITYVEQQRSKLYATFALEGVTLQADSAGGHSVLFSSSANRGAWDRLKDEIPKLRPPSIVLAADEDLRSFSVGHLFAALRKLHVTDNTNLREIELSQEINRLVDLKISDNPALQLISLPNDLPNLEQFTAVGNETLETFSIPATAPKLSSLSIFNNSHLTSVAMPSKLPGLQQLSVHSNPKLTSFQLPTDLTSLRSIDISDNAELASIQIISGSSNLKEIRINNNFSLKVLTLPNMLPELKLLEVIDNRDLTNISIPSNSNKVEAIVVGGTGPNHLDGLRNLSNLKAAAIAGPLLESRETAELATLPRLEVLLLPSEDEAADRLRRKILEQRIALNLPEVKFEHAPFRTSDWDNKLQRILKLNLNSRVEIERCRGTATTERIFSEGLATTDVAPGRSNGMKVRYAARVSFRACEIGDVRPIDYRRCIYYSESVQLIKGYFAFAEGDQFKSDRKVVSLPTFETAYFKGNCNEALREAFATAHQDALTNTPFWRNAIENESHYLRNDTFPKAKRLEE